MRWFRHVLKRDSGKSERRIFAMKLLGVRERKTPDKIPGNSQGGHGDG